MNLNHGHAAAAERAETRRHLLEAAAQVFAEVGFRAATVRDICRRAGANIAAVNYHFGDKETLYAEVLQRSLREVAEAYPPTLGLTGHDTPEQRLRAFVRSFVLRIFDQGTQAIRGRLMLREMVEPTQALDVVINESFRPMAGCLVDIVRDLLGGQASEETVRLCGMSIVSQAVFYNHCRVVIARLFPDMKFGAKRIERLSEHITAFCLAALKHVAKAQRTEARRNGGHTGRHRRARSARRPAGAIPLSGD